MIQVHVYTEKFWPKFMFNAFFGVFTLSLFREKTVIGGTGREATGTSHEFREVPGICQKIGRLPVVVGVGFEPSSFFGWGSLCKPAILEWKKIKGKLIQ